jgi:hypothetical protein
MADAAVAVVVPTIGRPELANLLYALAPQTTAIDRVLVVCDRPRRYDWCCALVEGLRKQGAQGRWTTWDRDNLGHYGHAARNEALDFLASLEQRPDWVWSIDDDDLCAPGALAAIRTAAASGKGKWYVAKMVGGGGSHFPDLAVPLPDVGVRIGNIGAPCIVAPTPAEARWGTSEMAAYHPGPSGAIHEAGYFGDGEYAVALQKELGEPVWLDAVVAEIRPSAAVPAILAPSSETSSTTGSAGPTGLSSQTSLRA